MTEDGGQSTRRKMPDQVPGRILTLRNLRVSAAACDHVPNEDEM